MALRILQLLVTDLAKQQKKSLATNGNGDKVYAKQQDYSGASTIGVNDTGGTCPSPAHFYLVDSPRLRADFELTEKWRQGHRCSNCGKTSELLVDSFAVEAVVIASRSSNIHEPFIVSLADRQ